MPPESVEVWASHCCLGHNPAALYLIADRLAPEGGNWAPFDRGALRSYEFPDPRRGTAEAPPAAADAPGADCPAGVAHPIVWRLACQEFLLPPPALAAGRDGVGGAASS